MLSQKLRSTVKQDSDEFLQILKNRNIKENGKPVFRRLFGIIDSETNVSSNTIEVCIETKIKNSKQLQKQENSNFVSKAHKMNVTTESKEKLTKSIISSIETDETNKTPQIRMEDIVDDNILLTSTSTLIEGENSNYKNPFGMENENTTHNHDTIVEDLEQDELQNINDSKSLREGTSVFKLSTSTENVIESDNKVEMGVSTENEKLKGKAEEVQRLREKIKAKRERNRTICNFGNEELFSENNAEIIQENSAKDNTVTCKSTNEANSCTNNKTASKITSKRLRNRTISIDSFPQCQFEDKDTNPGKTESSKALEIKLTNINSNEQKEKSPHIGKVSSLTKNFQEYINSSLESVKNESCKRVRQKTKVQNENKTCSDKNETIEHCQHAEISVASENNKMMTFNYSEKTKIEAHDLIVQNEQVEAKVKKHFHREDNTFSSVDNENTKNDSSLHSDSSKCDKPNVSAEKSMTGIAKRSNSQKELDCPRNKLICFTKSQNNSLEAQRKNIPFTTLNEKNADLLVKFVREDLKKKIRKKGLFAYIKRFFSKMFTQKWYEKELEKMECPDPFLVSLHKYIIENYTNVPSMFRLSADKTYYKEYPKNAAQNEKIDFDILTPHQVSALYKGYIRTILKGLIPSNLGKCLVEFLKLKDISEEDKKSYLITIAPLIISAVERSHLHDIFQMWDIIADNVETTKMDIVSLCIVFAPSIINDEFIVDIRDSKYLATILECFYMSNLSRIDHKFYERFKTKCKRLIN